MSLKLVSPPTALAINLEQAKIDLHVTSGSAEDAFIARLIRGATARAEHETGRAVMEQEWELIIDEFPLAEIELAHPPIMSITSVKLLDVAGVEQTLPPSAYSLDPDKLPGWLFPAIGTTWPQTICAANAVRVRFKCGYGTTAEAVQAAAPGLVDWIMVQVATLYDNRDAAALVKAESGSGMSSTFGSGLLDPYRTYL